MKKHTFYSLVLGANNKPVAQKWNGYTDNIFNYYRDNSGRWYAIEPTTGLSVLSADTRKAAQMRASTTAMFEQIKNALKPEMQERFKNALAEVIQ